MAKLAFSQLVNPYSQLSSQHRGLADTISSIRWYARTAGSLLKRIYSQMGCMSGNSFIWLPEFFYSCVPLSLHKYQGTKVTTTTEPHTCGMY
jgi:hypothetical protein